MITAIDQECRRQARLMGSAFEFIVSGENGHEKINEAIAEIKRIEDLLTEFSENSQTSQINNNAGIQAVEVVDEVYAIIKRCIQISALTQGSFDITAVALRKLYSFKGEKFIFPDLQAIQKTVDITGFKKIQLLPGNRVYLMKHGMRIGFGAIGKGYAADRAKQLLINKGVTSGVINASGDLTAWGTKPDGTSRKVGIADPENPDKVIAWIPVVNASVATSGDYEQYFIHEGERYSHALDPKTGKPVKGIKSVTIVAPCAELADALATAVMIMGVEIGLHFIEQLPSTHCLIIDNKNKIFTSRNLKINK
jgi:thiamine biosynthesis lipoprotein